MTRRRLGLVSLSLVALALSVALVAARGATRAVAARAARAEVVERYRIPLADGHATSSAAKVTIIEYSDFDCAYCRELERTVHKIADRYASRGVSLVWKDAPQPFHAHATLAAEAAWAAGDQGAFWPMHDALLDHPDALALDDLIGHARALHLDVERFVDDLNSHRFAPALARSRAEAARFEVPGVPAFYINGRPLRGRRSAADFAALIDEELAVADAALAHGTPLRELYAAIVADAPTSKRATAADRLATSDSLRNPDAVDRRQFNIAAGKSYTKGSATAPVTIIEFADFQCPFCAQIEQPLGELVDQYAGRVRLVFKNAPLPMHPYAQNAAEAALAAGAQGQFWPMHDLLFQNQNDLSLAALERYAALLHLDAAAFHRALDDHRFAGLVQEEAAQGDATTFQGRFGTPTILVNGRKVEGASYTTIKDAIERALDEASMHAGNP